MTFYYATAFKTGQYPIIVKDRIFLFARPHPANAKASNDTIEKPRDFELVRSHTFKPALVLILVLPLLD